MPSRDQIDDENEARRKLAVLTGGAITLPPKAYDDDPPPPDEAFELRGLPGVSVTYEPTGVSGGQRLKTRTVDGLTFTFDYNDDGTIRRISRPGPDGPESVTYAYDGSGHGSVVNVDVADGHPILMSPWRDFGSTHDWSPQPGFPTFSLSDSGWIFWTGRIAGGTSGQVAMRLPDRFGLGSPSARTFTLQSDLGAVQAAMSAYDGDRVSELTLTFTGSPAWVDLANLEYPFG